VNIPLVDLKAQYLSIQEEIDAAIQAVISETAFIGGPYVKAFEEAFAEFCGSKHCIGVGNGTDALFIALKCLGLGPGDEVFVPANSFIATAEAVTMTGARVAFVDIDPKTYNLDPQHLAHLLEKREADPSPLHPKAVIPVHLYGQPAEMDAIMEIANRYGLKVIEDCAQAHGAIYKGKKIGSRGIMGCFSFYPGKNLGAYGDGGAVVTDNEALAVKVRMMANHGRIGKYDHAFEGVNSRLDGLQAAILGAKLRHLPDWTEQRRRNAYRFNEILGSSEVVIPYEIEEVKAVYHLYVIRVKKEIRDALQNHLKNVGISTGIHYPIALPQLKAYAYLKDPISAFPVSTKASQEIISLPMFPELTESQIQRIGEEIVSYVKTNNALSR